MSNENNDNKLTQHEYDGIKELDNDLPRWWLALFYITMIFGGAYYAYYELGSGPTLKDELREELAVVEARKAAALGGKPAFPDATRLAASEKSQATIASGHAVFEAKCASCHGDKGQGLVGPNLTDKYWIHGDGKIAAIAKVIYSGVPEKGMPPWGAMLSEDEVYQLAAFVRSLRGTNPTGAKAPQGQPVAE